MNAKPWKILIADDEPKIRRGLHAQIDRLNLEVEVICEAEDGEVALEAAERLRPDILLVDINMPFMNGLDFIAAIRRTRADAKIIVITGYEEFDYARRALEMNVHAYLLKPIEVDELRNVLLEAIDQLETERERSRHFEWAISQIGNRREFLREEFLRDAIAGRIEEDEIRDFRVYFDFPQPVRMMLMLVSVRSSSADEKPWKNILRQYALQDALNAVEDRLRYSCLFCDDRGNVVMVYDAAEEMDEALAGIAERSLGTELGVQVHTAVLPLPTLTQISAVYDAAVEMGITEPTVPMWLPVWCILAEMKIDVTPTMNCIIATFSDGEKEAVLQITNYNLDVPFEYHKDKTEVTMKEVHGTEFYVLRNIERWSVTWRRENIECIIVMDCQENEIDKILRSIFTMEAE